MIRDPKSLSKLILYSQGWGLVEIYTNDERTLRAIEEMCVWKEEVSGAITAICNLYSLATFLVSCSRGDAVLRVLPKREFK
jgi:hypothetical protein